MSRYLQRNVLHNPSRIREQAAWQLLHAVRELFPDRCDELQSCMHGLPDEEPNTGSEDEVDELLWSRVCEWTARNNISCDAVNDAAFRWVVGDGPSSGVYVDVYFDENGKLVFHDTPSITASPYNETRKEFLQRAGRYYDELAEEYAARDGARHGPVKRDLDHFRYLAAHWVGGYSFAEIAREHVRFKVDAASPKTVAGEARKIARLIGLPLRTLRGPRPGSHLRRAAIRVRR